MNVIEQSQIFCFNYLACLRKIAKQFNLSSSQAICLNLIPSHGISQVNLAKKLSLDVSTLSRNLNHLITLNYINKTKSSYDKRSHKIFLSEKGVSFYKTFNNEVNNHLKHIFSIMSLDDVEDFSESLNKINWQFELSEK